MKKTLWIAGTIIIITVLGIYAWNRSGGEGEELTREEVNDMNQLATTVTLETNLGEIQFEFYEADAPKTVKNFITLTEEGFYDGLTFHRIIGGFMIQGGDPDGDGTGGPGYTFEDELNSEAESYKAGYKKGVVAMANAGPNTNGSQFFIMLEDYPLPNNYTIFGRVIKGQEVVDAIGKVETTPNDRPLEPVTIQKATIQKAGSGNDEVTTGKAIVESVELVTPEPSPEQVRVIAKGNLPDACTTIDKVTKERNENLFMATITTVRPTDLMCAQVLTPFEETISFNVEGLKAGVYIVDVNGQGTMFQLNSDNEL